MLYDSQERRRDLAAHLEGIADAETVEARVLVDTSQGRPAAETVLAAPASALKTLQSRGSGGRVLKQQQTALNR